MSRMSLLRHTGRTRSNLCIKASLSTSTDIYLDNLVVETGSKREKLLANYLSSSLESIEDKLSIHSRGLGTCKTSKNTELSRFSVYDGRSEQDIFKCLEMNFDFREKMPCDELKLQLIYFSKNGNADGVKAIQMAIKKHNPNDFYTHSEYKHYLAEALWIKGKVEESINIFLTAYTNPCVQTKVKLMLHALFPLLIDQHSQSILLKTISLLEKFSDDKQDPFLLALLWKELFKSPWFCDQQLAMKLLENNYLLIQVVQWMIPALGRDLLMNHKLDDFYRLIELSLGNDLKNFAALLLQLQFDYYCKYKTFNKAQIT